MKKGWTVFERYSFPQGKEKRGRNGGEKGFRRIGPHNQQQSSHYKNFFLFYPILLNHPPTLTPPKKKVAFLLLICLPYIFLHPLFFFITHHLILLFFFIPFLSEREIIEQNFPPYSHSPFIYLFLFPYSISSSFFFIPCLLLSLYNTFYSFYF